MENGLFIYISAKTTAVIPLIHAFRLMGNLTYPDI